MPLDASSVVPAMTELGMLCMQGLVLAVVALATRASWHVHSQTLRAFDHVRLREVPSTQQRARSTLRPRRQTKLQMKLQVHPQGRQWIPPFVVLLLLRLAPPT